MSEEIPLKVRTMKGWDILQGAFHKRAIVLWKKRKCIVYRMETESHPFKMTAILHTVD